MPDEPLDLAGQQCRAVAFRGKGSWGQAELCPPQACAADAVPECGTERAVGPTAAWVLKAMDCACGDQQSQHTHAEKNKRICEKNWTIEMAYRSCKKIVKDTLVIQV